MKGSRLELRDLVFGGVVTVDTVAGSKRVLKFTAAAVTIRDLKMAVPVGPQIQHIEERPARHPRCEATASPCTSRV
ncbi:hypothetical protein [Streptomyces griseus]|uniref:hypothetical protein n=1 Tax=Streptomyces griseus TaxID=1911 RepID=UPI00056987F4|nr:hypothetical protein [Streptomyces griseus]